jgi:hypothetical protein
MKVSVWCGLGNFNNNNWERRAVGECGAVCEAMYILVNHVTGQPLWGRSYGSMAGGLGAVLVSWVNQQAQQTTRGRSTCNGRRLVLLDKGPRARTGPASDK